MYVAAHRLAGLGETMTALSSSDFKLTNDGYKAGCTLLCIQCPRCNLPRCLCTALLLAGWLVTCVGGPLYPACNCCVTSVVYPHA
jgi:hypothetical protein